MFGRVMPASARQPKVQPGFGRTGDHMWGFRRHGVPPDIATMGNGYPLAGLAVRPKLLATFYRNVGYLNIFGGNTIVAAAGPAALDMIREEIGPKKEIHTTQSLFSIIDHVYKNY